MLQHKLQHKIDGLKLGRRVKTALIGWEDLTRNEKREFEYVDLKDEANFFRFKNQVYDLGEFIAHSLGSPYWHGATHHTAFSGVLVRVLQEHNMVIVTSYRC